MDPKALAKIYETAVTEQLGVIAKIDDDNDVVFKYPELGNMFFSLDAENDPEFMRLVYPNFTDQRLTGGDVEKLRDAVNTVNMSNKCVKLYLREDRSDSSMNVTASVEFLVAGTNVAPTQEHINATIKRTVSALRAGVMNLAKLARDGKDVEDV